MGRPSGTGRSPIRSFSQQVNRQLETGVPVERLEGSREAGGARRARKTEQPGTRRGRRGPRPEETRADRQSTERVSRRESEASSRSRRAEQHGGKPLTSDERALSSEAQRRSGFGERLRAKTAEPKARKQANAARERGFDPATAPRASASKQPLGQGQVAPLVQLQQNTQAAPAASGQAVAPLAKPVGNAGGALALPSAVELKAAPDAKPERAESAKPETATRWSESEAAERASAVLKQLRVKINPALRSASIQLAPADLGRLSIKLRVEDGRMHAVVRAESAETLGILEHHLPELQASLSSQGLEAESFELMLGFGDEQRGAKNSEGAAASSASAEDEQNEITIDTNRLARSVANRSGLDTYA